MRAVVHLVQVIYMHQFDRKAETKQTPELH